jgi:hypothetical protein
MLEYSRKKLGSQRVVVKRGREALQTRLIVKSKAVKK